MKTLILLAALAWLIWPKKKAAEKEVTFDFSIDSGGFDWMPPVSNTGWNQPTQQVSVAPPTEMEEQWVADAMYGSPYTGPTFYPPGLAPGTVPEW